jgi:hypothetical protein
MRKYAGVCDSPTKNVFSATQKKCPETDRASASCTVAAQATSKKRKFCAVKTLD